jgi:hypothetical protein
VAVADGAAAVTMMSRKYAKSISQVLQVLH